MVVVDAVVLMVDVITLSGAVDVVVIGVTGYFEEQNDCAAGYLLSAEAIG